MTLPDGLVDVIATAQPVTDRFAAAGHRLFLVGGIVRDHFAGRQREESDIDATTDARPPQIKAAVAEIADAVWTQGERFGTIGCRVDGEMYEITTHRAESYDEDSRKPTVSFGDRIEDDLARRDFTVNAMAVDLMTGELVDPHDGQGDLRDGVLRTPLDPEIAFSDDPLRMLRAARFHAGYGLVPAEELVAAMTAMAARLSIVSAERIRDEIQKLLFVDAPGSGFELLARTGLLAEALPSLPADPYAAALRGDRAAAMPPDAAMRWAALLAPGGVSPSALTKLKFSGAMTSAVIWFASAAEWVDDPLVRPLTTPALRRAAALVPSGRALTDLYDWVAAARRYHGLDTADVDAHREAFAALLAAEPDVGDPAPLLTGEAVCAVLDIAPGPEVGVAMRWLREIRLEEGPVDAVEAAERLVAWWPTRSDASA